MILPDVNVLLYAYDKSSQFNRVAARWLENILSNEEVFFSWHTITGFLRIITHPSALANPTTVEKAVSIVDSWLQLENTHLVTLEKKGWPLFSSILVEGQATGNLVMDAYLAATAVSCGAQVASSDRDFLRFSNVAVTDPLRPVQK